jgi:energy-coupling factor transporter ATP-binding protein EcfA2/ABC-type transport system involved in multi-copper enzyme maturation permease subunit
VGLGDRARLVLRKYSKGMLQRLGLAAAMVHEPELLILDEPMSGLDPFGRRDVRDLILEQNERGTTVMLSSHILPDVEALCDRVAIVLRGRLERTATVGELVEGGTPRVELRVAGTPVLEMPTGLAVVLERRTSGGDTVFTLHDTAPAGGHRVARRAARRGAFGDPGARHARGPVHGGRRGRRHPRHDRAEDGMTPALLIAHNTFREAVRDRVLAGIVVAGLVLIALTRVASPLAMGEDLRLTVDLSLSGITWLGMIVVLMVGSSLVAKEIDRRTIFNLLSRPLPRSLYLFGKWAGLSSALCTVAVVLAAALGGVLVAMGHGSYLPSVAQAAYLACLELMIVTAIAVLFSALSTPVLSALYTLGLFLAGQWCEDLRRFATAAPEGLNTLLETIANLLPNLPLFDMRTLAAGGQTTTPEHLGLATVYALVYSGCVLLLGAAAFESRDFK